MEFEHGMEWYLWNSQLDGNQDVISSVSFSPDAEVDLQVSQVKENDKTRRVDLHAWKFKPRFRQRPK